MPVAIQVADRASASLRYSLTSSSRPHVHYDLREPTPGHVAGRAIAAPGGMASDDAPESADPRRGDRARARVSSEETLLRSDLGDAVRTASQVSEVYLDALEDLVTDYANVLMRRGVSAAHVRSEVTAVIIEASGDSASPYVLHAARWMDALSRHR